MTGDSLVRALSGIRALVLDIDDTLVDTRQAMVAAGTHAARALWPDRLDVHEAMSRHYYTDPGRQFRRYAAGELSLLAMRLARLGDVARSFGVTVPQDALDIFDLAYTPAFRAAQRLFEDVPGLLDVAHAHNLPVALLTNSSDRDTRIKLEALGLAERLDLVVTTDTIGVGKPDPRVYAAACRLVGVRLGEAVCIGDSLEWDVHGAIAAGMRAIWLDRAGVGAAAVPTVISLTEVTEALRRFGPPARGG
jgi:putative hydrolase of the HAD superfamily